jgi:hypothetical protein
MIINLRSASLIALASFCLVACSKSKHDLLAKRWKIKEMHAGSPEAEKSEAMFPALAAEIRASLNYNFHPDGTEETMINDKVRKTGTWSIDDGGTKLSLTIPGKDVEEWTIVELKSDLLSVTEKNGTRTVFIPK